jgi:hypothetical protein
MKFDECVNIVNFFNLKKKWQLSAQSCERHLTEDQEMIDIMKYKLILLYLVPT